MSMQEIITTLHEFLERWLTDAGFREQYDGDVEAAMSAHGFDDIDPATLLDALPLVAEDLPLAYQRSVYDYMNTVNNVDTGSNFNVQQGGAANVAVNEGAAAVAASAQAGAYPGEEPMDAAARHIYNIQNVYETNYSYIEDNDVVTTITAGGDVDFDQNVADDGAIAGDDISGANTGENSGIISGGDTVDSDVTNVEGDGNLTTGDIVGDDVNVGGTQYNVDGDGSAVAFGSGAATIDNSTNDSFNTDNSIDDSFNTKDSFNATDNSINDSFNQDNDLIDDKDLVDYDDNDAVDIDDNDVVDDKDFVDDKDVVDYDDQDVVDYDDQDAIDAF